MPEPIHAYQTSLTKFIQAHMVMIGPSVILSLVRKIPGITITNTGVVQQLDENPHELIKQVSSVCSPFGGVLTQRLHAQLFSETTTSTSVAAIPGKP